MASWTMQSLQAHLAGPPLWFSDSSSSNAAQDGQREQQWWANGQGEVGSVIEDGMTAFAHLPMSETGEKAGNGGVAPSPLPSYLPTPDPSQAAIPSASPLPSYRSPFPPAQQQQQQQQQPYYQHSAYPLPGLSPAPAYGNAYPSLSSPYPSYPSHHQSRPAPHFDVLRTARYGYLTDLSSSSSPSAFSSWPLPASLHSPSPAHFGQQQQQRLVQPQYDFSSSIRPTPLGSQEAWSAGQGPSHDGRDSSGGGGATPYGESGASNITYGAFPSALAAAEPSLSLPDPPPQPSDPSSHPPAAVAASSASSSKSVRPSSASTRAKGAPRARATAGARRRAPPPRTWVCPEEGCDKSFARPSALTSHLRTHSKDRPYVCPCCDRPFSVIYNLQRHMKTHPEVDIRNVRPADIPNIRYDRNGKRLRPPSSSENGQNGQSSSSSDDSESSEGDEDVALAAIEEAEGEGPLLKEEQDGGDLPSLPFVPAAMTGEPVFALDEGLPFPPQLVVEPGHPEFALLPPSPFPPPPSDPALAFSLLPPTQYDPLPIPPFPHAPPSGNNFPSSVPSARPAPWSLFPVAPSAIPPPGLASIPEVSSTNVSCPSSPPVAIQGEEGGQVSRPVSEPQFHSHELPARSPAPEGIEMRRLPHDRSEEEAGVYGQGFAFATGGVYLLRPSGEDGGAQGQQKGKGEGATYLAEQTSVARQKFPAQLLPFLRAPAAPSSTSTTSSSSSSSSSVLSSFLPLSSPSKTRHPSSSGGGGGGGLPETTFRDTFARTLPHSIIPVGRPETPAALAVGGGAGAGEPGKTGANGLPLPRQPSAMREADAGEEGRGKRGKELGAQEKEKVKKEADEKEQEQKRWDALRKTPPGVRVTRRRASLLAASAGVGGGVEGN
ncbi:hypothetical protein JCM8547_007290 [Rhodosporidiobolus lusitaniae]